LFSGALKSVTRDIVYCQTPSTMSESNNWKITKKEITRFLKTNAGKLVSIFIPIQLRILTIQNRFVKYMPKGRLSSTPQTTAPIPMCACLSKGTPEEIQEIKG
jgi:hypothetical protein